MVVVQKLTTLLYEVIKLGFLLIVLIWRPLVVEITYCTLKVRLTKSDILFDVTLLTT